MDDVSIIDIVSKYYPVNVFDSKELGKRAACDCPFCKSYAIKSFIVSDKEGKYNCFSCGETGDASDFLVKVIGITKEEAQDLINEKKGIITEFKKELDKENDTIYTANKVACEYYYSALKNNPKAYNYFRDRGLTDDTIKKFGLGYSKYGVCSVLKQVGFSEKVIDESGLGKITAEGKTKDKMINRVMFPIIVKVDGIDRIAGFGGRLMEYPNKNKDIPKYINTKGTSAFDKKSTLYAFNYAINSKREGIILCEGYMDTIALHQAGFDNAVASLGTAFTRFHALKLKEVTQKVYLCFDSDEAGINAKLKAIPILRNVGLEVKVLDCSPYKDPDELIKEEGKKGFQKVIENAIDSYTFEIECLKKSSVDFEYDFAHMIYNINEQDYSNYIEAYKELEKKEFNSFSENNDKDKENVKDEDIQEYDESKSDLYQDVMNEFEIDFEI